MRAVVGNLEQATRPLVLQMSGMMALVNGLGSKRFGGWGFSDPTKYTEDALVLCHVNEGDKIPVCACARQISETFPRHAVFVPRSSRTF